MNKEYCPVKLSVIMPVYNEVKTIKEIIRRVRNVSLEKEIIIVDDHSTDGTKEILKGLDSELTIIYQPRNMGKGAAIRRALEYVTGELVIIQDADLEYNPKEYHKLIAPIIQGQADVVYGSRLSRINLFSLRKTIAHYQRPRFWYFSHYLGNKFLTLITNILYHARLTDMETGYKMFKAEVLKSVKIRSNRFNFEPEITAKVLKKGYRIYETPISYEGRTYGEGKKITWKDGLVAILTLLKYRIKD